MIPRKHWPLAAVVAAGVTALALWGKSLYDERWLPPGPPEVAGRVLMERKRCVRCHRISGTGGQVGPDLTVVARRRSLEWMRSYLDEPRAVDPNARMPQPTLTAEQRDALLAYLATLDGVGVVPPGAAN
ncbi:MAG TPA: cytochrome c [Verrucomicrobiae bacterium]|nr:cytochrome c [Verrucomicrobiae bacterium]